MTKRRPSIRGRGAEILFGAPPTVELLPHAPDPDLPEAEAEAAQADLAAEVSAEAEDESWLPPLDPGPMPDLELERALLEEARDGAYPSEEDWLDRLEDPAPTLEVETAFTEEDTVATEPPELMAEDPIPTLEATMNKREQTREEPLYEPPPPETDDVSVGVLPPRPDSLYVDLGSEESILRDIQSEDEEVDWLELPERALTDEERAHLLARLGRARIRELDAQIDEMYDQVLSEVAENESIATECYNLLLRSRDILLRRDAARIPQAEYYIEQVRARLKRADESEHSAGKYQWWILGWGLLWCAVFLTLVISLNQAWFQNIVAVPGGGDAPFNVVVFLTASIWGGIGGVVAIFYSLFKHVGRRDFDDQYSISYVGKPFLGLILGATVYMIFNLLIRALGIWPAGMEGAEASLAVAPGVVYLMAWASGFKENRIFDLVDRVMKRLFSGKDEEESEPFEESAELQG